MQRDEVRKAVEDQFYKSLAESGVEVTAVPAVQLRAMILALADSLFAVLDALEGAESPADGAVMNPEEAAAAAGDPLAEQTLWRGRPYLTIGTRYELTTQRLRILRGILGNTVEEIELVRVKDTRVKQHVGERMLNVGDVSVFSADPTTPEFILHNVRNPIDVRELIRKTVIEEKARRGMRYREDIGEESGQA
jgi:hypothetical protein